MLHFPTFSFSKPGDAVSLRKMKHISIPGKQARAQLDDILHASFSCSTGARA